MLKSTSLSNNNSTSILLIVIKLDSRINRVITLLEVDLEDA
jgi:hypothetical protein